MTAARRRVVVAMSGGVDSSVAAALLARGSDEVLGVTLCLRPPESAAPSRACCGVDDLAMARAVADRIGIPHYVVDARAEFERLVLRPAWEDYDGGRTPNPCVRCNERIKLGLLLAHARSLGADAVATGHHARVEAPGGDAADDRPVLRRGRDRRRDQSYFLFAVGAEELRRTWTPIGAMTKDEVRAFAAGTGLPNAGRPGSRDACLAAEDGSFAEALRRLFDGVARPGRVVDRAGGTLGAHRGCHRFTVGQRHGLGVGGGGRRYVLSIDPPRGEVVVGSWDELLCGGLRASGVRWLVDPPDGEIAVGVQTRYRQPEVPARVVVRGDGGIEVRFDAPAAAVAPGQAVVLYDGDRVIGGGWIDERLEPPVRDGGQPPVDGYHGATGAGGGRA